MNAEDDQPSPRELTWDVDLSNNLGFPSFLCDASAPEDADTTDLSSLDMTSKHYDLGVPLGDQPSYTANMTSPVLDFFYMMDSTPSSTAYYNDSVCSPSSGGATFASPSVALDTPSLSSSLFTEPLPQLETHQNIDMPQNVSYHLENASMYTGAEDDFEVSPILPEASVQQSYFQEKTSASQLPITQGRPPELKARQWRELDRPVKCPICNKGHTYSAELKRHIRSNHPDDATMLGVSTARFTCSRCSKSYARSDHLKRHLTNKHGRPKTKTRDGVVKRP